MKDLETRGSKAFPAFLECLQETGQHLLAELLERGTSAPVSVPVPLPVQPVILLPIRKSASQTDHSPQCKVTVYYLHVYQVSHVMNLVLIQQ